MIVDYLILSSIFDFSTDLVVQELERRNEKYIRLNRENFHTYRLTIDISALKLEIVLEGMTYLVTAGLKSIYYRQPVFLRNTPGELLTINEQLERSQWMGFLRSLVIFDRAKWLNPLSETYLAETKSYQLHVANNLGFHIPKTIIGNNSERFQEFTGKIIIKSLDTVLLRENEDCLFAYSTVESADSLNDSNVSAAPLTVQEYLYPKTDIRVTIVGREIFAVKITADGKGIEEDWRLVSRNLIEYSTIKLPSEIANYCLQLMNRLNLNFGAIDLIECNNKYFFIEINPTGEWGWLVTEQRRIDLSIVNWLSSET